MSPINVKNKNRVTVFFVFFFFSGVSKDKLELTDFTYSCGYNLIL